MESYTFDLEDFTSEPNADNISIVDLYNQLSDGGSGIYSAGLNHVKRVGNTYVCVYEMALSTGDVTLLNNWIADFEITGTSTSTGSCTLLEKTSSGTDAGTFTQDVWTARNLNKVRGTASFVTLSNGRFTLAPGSYELEVSAMATSVNAHRCRLYDYTNSVQVACGTSAYADANEVCSTTSNLKFALEVGVSTTYEIQHRCSTTKADTGMGKAAGFGSDEIYVIVLIHKIGSVPWQ